MRVGVDTGGTFTDLVADDGRIAKVPSTPSDPGDAVRRAIAAITTTRPDVLAHRTTVATNALLEHAPGAVALVTNRGFADVIEIARQARPSLYDAHIDRPPPLVARELRFEVGGRLDAAGRGSSGSMVGFPTSTWPPRSRSACSTPDLDSSHERAVAAVLEARAGLDVTVSSDVSPEFREYERMVTTVANAALRPVCRSYLHGLHEVARETLVITSAGGLIPVGIAAELPVTAAALRPCGRRAGRGRGRRGVRVSARGLVRHGRHEHRRMPGPRRRSGAVTCPRRGRVPDSDAGPPVHTIGAGGGSVARLERVVR